jgi:HD-like signal output (HDOD) protein
MKEALRTQALERCWRHTLASAILCRELAQTAGLPGDRAYSFGLLHDIGRLGLLVAYPHSYDRLLQAASRDSASLLDLEKKQFGMDHCEAGRHLAEEWQLPPEFRLIAGGHHDPPPGAPFDALKLVHLACRLADALGYSVAASQKDIPLEEIRALLPADTREHHVEDPDSLRQIIDRAMGQDATLFEAPEAQHSGTSAPSENTPLTKKVREDSIAISGPPTPPASRTWGAVLLVAMVLLVLAAGIFCLWNA